MIRAVICDVYHTLLKVRPGPPDPDRLWFELCARFLPRVSVPTLEGVRDRARELVEHDHAAARNRGVLFPEVVWPEVMRRLLPELQDLDAGSRDAFLLAHQRLLRACELMPGAGNLLRAAISRGVLLGIASNAQRYTLRELDDALAAEGLTRDVFDPRLVLWSFELGFSKPNPHVFAILTGRLADRGIAASEVLMIGDREDNDIAPARAFGWQTLRVEPEGEGWQEALDRL